MLSSVKFMLKKTGWVLALASLAINFAWAKNYEGHGSTRTEAREDLAKTILTSIKSEFESDTKIEGNAFTKNVSQSSRQSSNVILVGVKVTQTDTGEFIATLNKEQFKKDAELTLNKVIAACETELPKAWQPRRQVLMQCVQDVDAAVSMARVVGKQSDISRLSPSSFTVARSRRIPT